MHPSAEQPKGGKTDMDKEKLVETEQNIDQEEGFSFEEAWELTGMTDKELRRLRRVDLLEMLVEQMKENAALQKQNEELQAGLEERRIKLSNAGSIAEAALQLSGVFESAQEACDRYLESVRAMDSEMERVRKERIAEVTAECDALRAMRQEELTALQKEIELHRTQLTQEQKDGLYLVEREREKLEQEREAFQAEMKRDKEHLDKQKSAAKSDLAKRLIAVRKECDTLRADAQKEYDKRIEAANKEAMEIVRSTREMWGK